MHVCVLLTSSCEDSSQGEAEPTLMTSFQLNCPFEGPVSQYSPSEVLGVRTSACELGRTLFGPYRDQLYICLLPSSQDQMMYEALRQSLSR